MKEEDWILNKMCSCWKRATSSHVREFYHQKAVKVTGFNHSSKAESLYTSPCSRSQWCGTHHLPRPPIPSLHVLIVRKLSWDCLLVTCNRPTVTNPMITVPTTSSSPLSIFHDISHWDFFKTQKVKETSCMYLFLMGLGLEVVGYMKNFFFFFAFILRYLRKISCVQEGY